MIGSLFFKLLSVVAPSVASYVVGSGGTPPPTELVQTIVEVRANAPVATGLGWFDPDKAAAVPLVVRAETQTGELRDIELNLPLKENLVDAVKDGFGPKARSVLREVEKALVEGTRSPDEAVRGAALAILPQVQSEVPYEVNPGLSIPEQIEEKVAQIAKKTFQQTGKKLVVTSAARSPIRQADAMRTKLELGESPRRLYANKRAAGEIELAYRYAKKVGLDEYGVTQTMATVIQRQIDSGVFISRHLKEGAVDIRSRDLSWHEKQVVRQAAEELGARVLLETTPPHFHLEL